MIFPELESSPFALVRCLHDGGMVFYPLHWWIFVFSSQNESLGQWWAGSLNGGMIFPELERSPFAMVRCLYDGGMVFFPLHRSIFVFSSQNESLSQWWAGSLNGGMIFPELEMSPFAMVRCLQDGRMVFYLLHWSTFIVSSQNESLS